VKNKNRTLRTELILYFLLLSVLPLILVSLFSYQQASQGLTLAAKKQLEDSAKLHLSFIENWFDYRLMDLNTQAMNHSTSRLLQDRQQRFQRSGLTLNDYTKSPEWDQIDKSAPLELINFINYYDYINDLFLIDKQGNILYSFANRAELGTNIYNGPYAKTLFANSVKKTLRSQYPFFSDLEHYAPSGNDIVGFITVPVPNKEGAVIGVLAIQIHLDRIFDLLKNKNDDTVKQYLIGKNGYLRTPLTDNYSEVFSLQFNTKKTLTSSENGHVTHYKNLNNVAVIGLQHHLQILGVDWTLISEVAESDALAASIWLGKIVASLVIITILLVTLLSFYVSRRITLPIEKLAVATRAVASGDMNQQVTKTTNNEIGHLADAFNKMVIKRNTHERLIERSNQQTKHALLQLKNQQYAMDQHSIVAITDIKGIITYANDKFCAISGYSRKELIGHNHRIIQSGVHDSVFFRDLYQVISRGNVWNGEICNRAKEGHHYWLDTSIVPLMGKNNKPEEYITIRTDISVRKKAELAAVKSEKNLALLVNTIPYGIQENNADGIITFSNIAHHRILGWELGTFIGLPIWHSASTHKEQQKLRDHLTYLFKEQPKPESYITTNTTKEGKDVLLEVIWDYKRDAHNKVIGLISIISDITERKQSEQTLQRAQKMDAVGQLTGGIAHDFNNILGIVIGNLDLLEPQFTDNPKAQRRLAAALKAANRATNLTKKLLGFSRQKATESQVVNVNVIVLEMDDMLHHSLGPDIELKYAITNDIWHTEIDPGDLQDTLLNLMINAHDAMPKGGMVNIETTNCTLDEIVCETSPGLTVGQYVQLTISDNGIGIPKDQQQNIFEPFYTTKALDKGTGLGLAMVFGFVKRSNGHIQVYSELSIGTTFKIYLPRYLDQKTIEAASKKQLAPPAITPQGNETLLVVDDEQGLVELAQDVLTALGYTVLTANDAQQALSLLSTEPNIACLFSDVIMPGGMNGYELATAANKLNPNLKILLTSGFTGKAIPTLNETNACFELLTKPYNQFDLAASIRKTLDSV